METKPIPDGFHSVTPYLLVNEPAKLIDFMINAFEGKELLRMSAPDGSVAHAEVKMGDSIIMMGKPKDDFQPMSTMLYFYVEDCDAVYKKALKAGGVSVMEPADQFYGDRNAGVKDFAGNLWWIATHIEDVTEEEVRRRAEEMAQEHQ